MPLVTPKGRNFATLVSPEEVIVVAEKFDMDMYDRCGQQVLLEVAKAKCAAHLKDFL